MKANEKMAESKTPLTANQVIADLDRRYQLMMTMEPDLQLFREIHDYVGVIEDTHGLSGHFLYEEFTKWQEIQKLIDSRQGIRHEGVFTIFRELYFWPVFDELWQVYGAIRTLKRKVEEDGRPETGMRFAMLLEEFAVEDKPTPENHFLLRKDRYKNWLRFTHPIVIEACKTWLDNPQGIEKRQIISLDSSGVLTIGSYKISLNLRSEKTNAFYLMEKLLEQADHLDDRFYYDELLIDVNDDPKSESGWKKYYRAAKDIYEKIDNQTDGAVRDFILFSSGKNGWIQINSRYLPSPEDTG